MLLCILQLYQVLESTLESRAVSESTAYRNMLPSAGDDNWKTCDYYHWSSHGCSLEVECLLFVSYCNRWRRII
jgi:hypothetical protein